VNIMARIVNRLLRLESLECTITPLPTPPQVWAATLPNDDVELLAGMADQVKVGGDPLAGLTPEQVDRVHELDAVYAEYHRVHEVTL
jgi:alpha-L-fucosidase